MIQVVMIRVVLTILVALPPGTFRALDSLTRTSGVSRSTPMASIQAPGRASEIPQKPLRLRGWAAVTFVTSESPALNAELDAAPPMPVVADARPALLPVRRQVGTSPRLVDASPREALLASRALLN